MFNTQISNTQISNTQIFNTQIFKQILNNLNINFESLVKSTYPLVYLYDFTWLKNYDRQVLVKWWNRDILDKYNAMQYEGFKKQFVKNIDGKNYIIV